MTTKKAIRPKRKSPGIKSPKRAGVVAQTIRIEATDNRTIHKAAKGAKQSFNSWAVDALITAAKVSIHERETKLAHDKAVREEKLKKLYGGSK